MIKRLWADDGGRIALNMIITRLCGLHTMSFDPGNTFQTAYNEGRRSIGHDLMRVINTPTAKLFEGKDESDSRTNIPTATERAASAAAERAIKRTRADRKRR